MEDIIIIAIVILIVSLAGMYIYKEKKKGKKCIGCPSAGACEGVCHNCSGFSAEKTK